MADENNNNGGDETEVLDEEQQQQQGGEGGEGGGEGGKGTITMSEEKLSEILSTVVGAGREPEKREDKQPELTREEVDKLLNVYKVDDKLVADLRAEDPKVAAAVLQKIVEGVVLQANTMADARIQQVVGKLVEEKLTPLERYYQEAAAQRESETFYGKYPELKAYEFVVDGVAAKLDSNGFKAATKEKFLEEIAKTSHDVLKAMGVTVKKDANGNSAARQSSSSGSRMSSLSTGSGQRASGGSSAQSKRKEGMSVFDDKED